MIAQVAADVRGHIGPFQLAMVITAVAWLLVYFSWSENYGDVGKVRALALSLVRVRVELFDETLGEASLSS